MIAHIAVCAIVAAAPTPADLSLMYPGPWMDAPHRGIIKALIKANVRDCGEFYYRENKDHKNEFLVYGTRDGKRWSCYLVWPSISKVMGPYPIDRRIPPPR